MLTEVRLRKTKASCLNYIFFLRKYTWKIDPKINMYKNKHDHIQTQMRNMFVTWNFCMELREGGKGKENDKASTIS
jgi:hypothetical protein